MWLLIDAPQMGVNQIDRGDLDFDRGPRRKIRERRDPDIERGAGDPDEIGPLAVYLASPASSYVTGAAYVIDGGYTLW